MLRVKSTSYAVEITVGLARKGPLGGRDLLVFAIIFGGLAWAFAAGSVPTKIVALIAAFAFLVPFMELLGQHKRRERITIQPDRVEVVQSVAQGSWRTVLDPDDIEDVLLARCRDSVLLRTDAGSVRSPVAFRLKREDAVLLRDLVRNALVRTQVGGEPNGTRRA